MRYPFLLKWLHFHDVLALRCMNATVLPFMAFFFASAGNLAYDVALFRQFLAVKRVGNIGP